MNNYQNKKILVVGLSKSGMAAIKLLHQLKANIFLSDIKKPSEDELEILNKLNVTIYNQDLSVFEKEYDLVIKNPGVSPLHPLVKRLKERNIPIITEIELAYSVMKKQHIIAITGTNGKTTCTTIVYELLKKAFKEKALVGGNIGTPLCDLVLENDLLNNDGYYIALEISNHQLIDIKDFKPEVSTIINLTPDHLETMGSLANYYHSKTLVYKNSDENDLFLYNLDDLNIKEYCRKYPIKANIQTFSLIDTNAYCHLEDGYIVLDNKKILELNKITIVGKHNIQNIMIAIMAAKKYNISNDDINEVISNFKAVEHRIEFVKEINGVKYYNDSKATNIDATITALKAFDSNVILLVGGYEKGLDTSELKNYLGCVEKIIGFGSAGKRIAKSLDENATIVNNLNEAVNFAYHNSKANDIVLLSPTTSSYDQYKNYEERGRHFKELVNKL